MTDVPAPSHGALIGAAKTNRRLRRRRWAVIRLQAYGIAAIAVAGLALVALLSSVFVQTASVLTESYVTLEVELSPEELGIAADADAKTILRSDFNGLTKATLRAAFPEITGRKEKRELYDVVSGGAAFELADHVSANPELLGQTIRYPFLASDVTDLYLKGFYGALQPVAVEGRLSLAVDGDRVRLDSSADDFAAALAVVKQSLKGDAARLRRQAALQNNGVQVFQRRAESAETEAERAAFETQAQSRAAERDRLLAEAEALEKRAATSGGAEALERDNRSLLIRVAGAWIKLERLDASSAEGRVLTGTPAPLQNAQDWELFATETPEAARKVSDLSIAIIEDLRERGAIEQVFNWRFFTASDSREPELAGIRGAAVGSFWTMLVTFCLAFPIGVLAAIYLEEFAPRNRFTNFIEVNINNLAAVPSIVFGLLGLAVFLGVFGVPRSSPLAGGIVLALMTLPTIIIASRAAIKAVPPSIRDAALGVGASKLQATFHHVLPLAMPGVLTGTIIGMAQALGETAPLIMIGMVAFIVEVPSGITESATVLPVQVYRWSDFPERAFEAKTGAAIAVLLFFLVAMNAIAIVLRRRFERRW